jgi:hypothetical protein
VPAFEQHFLTGATKVLVYDSSDCTSTVFFSTIPVFRKDLFDARQGLTQSIFFHTSTASWKDVSNHRLSMLDARQRLTGLATFSIPAFAKDHSEDRPTMLEARQDPTSSVVFASAFFYPVPRLKVIPVGCSRPLELTPSG